jgi:hypothetical protein
MKHYTPDTWNFNSDKNRFEDSKIQRSYSVLQFASTFVEHLTNELEKELVNGETHLKLKKDGSGTQPVESLSLYITKGFESIVPFYSNVPELRKEMSYVGKFLSALSSRFIQNPTFLQGEGSNALTDKVKAILNETNNQLNAIKEDLKNNWETSLICDGYLDPKYKEELFVSTTYDFNEIGLDPTSLQYTNLLVHVKRQILFFIVKDLLKLNWKIRNWPTFLVKESYVIEGQRDTIYWDFDYVKANPQLDQEYSVQKFEAFPDKNLGSYYEHRTADGPRWFQAWLQSFVAANGANIYNYENYSSYYNWSEQADFTEGSKQYKARRIYNHILVDEAGEKASTELTEWLFKDDVHGNISQGYGIALREDVYKNWGLNTESLSDSKKVIAP